jgi:hypothetical protein
MNKSLALVALLIIVGGGAAGVRENLDRLDGEILRRGRVR